MTMKSTVAKHIAPFAFALGMGAASLGSAQSQAPYVCAPGTVPNVAEARTPAAIASLEGVVNENVPSLAPYLFGKDKLVFNFEGSGPVSLGRLGNDVTFAQVNVGENIMRGDGASTQDYGFNNEGQTVQTLRIEDSRELAGLVNVVQQMCVNYEIEIGVRDADGNVIDESRRRNNGFESENYAGINNTRDFGARSVGDAIEGMAIATRIDLEAYATDAFLGRDFRAEFQPADPNAAAYEITQDSLFLAASAQGRLGTLILSDGENAVEYELTANVSPSQGSYTLESHVGSNLSGAQVENNRAMNAFASTLGPLFDEYGFTLSSENNGFVRSYSSEGELEGDLSRLNIHRVELDPRSGSAELFYRLNPNDRNEQERSKTLVYQGEQGSFEQQLAVANLYAAMQHEGLTYDQSNLPHNNPLTD